MDRPSSHRKRVKHFNAPGHVHELTFSCYRRESLLVDDHCRAMLAESIQRADVRHSYRLIAFVFMPDHVHLLVACGQDGSPIDAYLKAVKRPFSFRVKQHLDHTDRALLDRPTIRQRRGVQTFRFWQEGPGYDRNLTSREAVLAAIDYLHLNPVRRGLCTKAVDWHWFSARHYLRENASHDPGLPIIDGLPANWFNPGGVETV